MLATQIEQLGHVESGSLVVVHDPERWTPETFEFVRRTISDCVGHDQFCLIVVRNSVEVAVVGPEGMRDVLARMATEQLRLLAGCGAQ